MDQNIMNQVMRLIFGNQKATKPLDQPPVSDTLVIPAPPTAATYLRNPSIDPTIAMRRGGREGALNEIPNPEPMTGPAAPDFMSLYSRDPSQPLRHGYRTSPETTADRMRNGPNVGLPINDGPSGPPAPVQAAAMGAPMEGGPVGAPQGTSPDQQTVEMILAQANTPNDLQPPSPSAYGGPAQISPSRAEPPNASGAPNRAPAPMPPAQPMPMPPVQMAAAAPPPMAPATPASQQIRMPTSAPQPAAQGARVANPPTASVAPPIMPARPNVIGMPGAPQNPMAPPPAPPPMPPRPLVPAPAPTTQISLPPQARPQPSLAPSASPAPAPAVAPTAVPFDSSLQGIEAANQFVRDFPVMPTPAPTPPSAPSPAPMAAAPTPPPAPTPQGAQPTKPAPAPGIGDMLPQHIKDQLLAEAIRLTAARNGVKAQPQGAQ